MSPAVSFAGFDGGTFMRRVYFLVLLVLICFGPVLAARGQDDQTPSLGDVARQARLAKQQKDAQAASVVSEQVKEGENRANASNDTSGESATAPPQKDVSQTKIENSQSASAKSTQSAKAQKRILTNDDLGAAHNAAGSLPETKTDPGEPKSADQADQKNPPDYWTTRILAQKNSIASLKSDIDQLTASIQYAPGNCVEGCVEWNEHQQQKQQQVDTMKAQLEEQQKQLEEMQEAARKQGYGSSIYDP
jgi:hypothetical protein